MSENHHVPIVVGAPGNAATVNAPLGALDAAITAEAVARAGGDSGFAAALDAASGGYPSLDARLDAFSLVGAGSAWTQANGGSSSGQKVIAVDDASGFSAGMNVIYQLTDGSFETNVIASIGANNITHVTNLSQNVVDDAPFVFYPDWAKEMAAAPESNQTLLPADAMRSATQRVFNVLDYIPGGAPDGTTDNTAHIQAAIDAAEAAGHGRVVIPRTAANYRVSGTGWTVTSDDIEIVGVGMPTIQALVGLDTDSVSPAGAVFFVTGCSHVYITGLIIDCTLGTASSGIKFYHCVSCTAERVKVIGCQTVGSTQAGLGFWISGRSHYNRVINCQAIDIEFSAFDVAIDSTGNNYEQPEGNIFAYCYAENPGNDGYDIFQTRKTSVLFCTVTGAGRVGIHPTGGADTVVSIRSASFQWTVSASGTSEYYLEASGGGDPGLNATPQIVEENSAAMTAGALGTLAAGEWAWGDNDGLGYSTVYVRLTDSTDPDTKALAYVEATYQNYNNDVLILGCTAKDSIVAPIGAGIQMDDLGYRARVIGNKSINNATHGIRSFKAWAVISDNLIMGNGAKGLDVGGANCIITGNTLLNNGTSAVADPSIRLSGSGLEQCIVANNFIQDGAGDGIFVDGPNYVKVTGNTVDRCGFHGIHMDTTVYSSVDGNTVRRCDGHGIMLENFDNGSVRNNMVVGNSQATDDTFDGIRIESGSDFTHVADNMVRHLGGANQHKYGINIATSDCDETQLFNNSVQFGGRTANINNSGTLTIMRTNHGFVTEAKGTATVAAGSTSVAVNHGLAIAVTPGLSNFQVTPTNNMGAATKFWISSPTTTQFTVNVDGAPGGSGATFVWQAQVL